MIGIRILIILWLVNKLGLVTSASIIGAKASRCSENSLKGADCEEGFIRIQRRHKRSIDNKINMEMSAFGKEIKLVLKKSGSVLFSAATPVYKLFKNHDMSYSMYRNEPDVYSEKETFEDMVQYASITFVTQPNGLRTIESGSIGSENLFIIPIPQSRKYQFYKFNNNNYYYTRNDNKYQTSNAYNSPITNYPYLSNNNFYTYYQQINTIPDTIYPEILIIVDYQLLVNIGEDKIIIYLIQFWNQVDLLFRTLSNPQYKLNIAGIVIPMEPDTLQYLTDGSFYSYSQYDVDLHIALRSFKKWIYQQRYVIPIDSYDLAITMTSKVTNGNLYGFSYGEVVGRALTSSACAVDHLQQQVLKAGIIAADGDFQDVLTAAHEVGHILGATHDDAECPSSEGYIMSSAVIPGIYSTQWSRCSLRDFTNFLRTNPTCLFNEPKA